MPQPLYSSVGAEASRAAEPTGPDSNIAVGSHAEYVSTVGQALNPARPGRCEKPATVTASVYCRLIKGDRRRLLRNYVGVHRRPITHRAIQLGLPR